jgi:hypothetical protein
VTPGRAVQIVAILLGIVGVGWAMYQGILTLVVVEADGFPQCTGLDPDKGLLALLAVSAVVFSITGVWAAISGRLVLALTSFAAEALAVAAWLAAEGLTAAGCVIG